MEKTQSDPFCEFSRFVGIIKTLRGPDGCPWDKEQTPITLRGNLIEEVYETIEAINMDNHEHICEELGDVLLLVMMISEIYSEQQIFSITDVLKAISDKLVRRHPHVFGSLKVNNTQEILKNWDQIKCEVEGRKESSALDNIPASYPPLLKSLKLQRKAAKKGFDWPDTSGPKGKICEELQEFQEAEGSNKEEELGDLLFSIVNYARHLNLDPDLSLQKANTKFENRFRYVERQMAMKNISMQSSNLELMNQYWEQSKSFMASEMDGQQQTH